MKKKSLTYWDQMPYYHGTNVKKLLHWLLLLRRWSNSLLSQKPMSLDSIEVLRKMFSFSLFAVVTEFSCHCREASQLASVGVCWRRLKVKDYKCSFLEYLWRFVLFWRKWLAVTPSKPLGVQETDNKQYHCGDTGKKAYSPITSVF